MLLNKTTDDTFEKEFAEDLTHTHIHRQAYIHT